MKTSKRKPLQSKLVTLAGVVFAVFVLRALVGGADGTGGVDTGLDLDLSPVVAGLGSFAEAAVLWIVVIPAGLYLLYLAVMKVAPAQMSQDHAERAAKRMRKWAIIGTIVLALIAYALHYVPILAGAAAARAGAAASGGASGLGNAADALGEHWVPIVWLVLLAAVLCLGYWWSTKSDSKLEQIARFGMVGIPAVLVSLALGAVEVIGP